tara:strand:+ start:325 stop:1824 length:1500 start_codon:yes stop_codon:yes gene_type:complete
MKSYLIIPMGGAGKRFVKMGYKTYKVFLPVGKKVTILENIISNFKGVDIEVLILANFQLFGKKYNKFLNKKNFHLINIKSHKKGPLYSLYLGRKKIKEIIKNNNNIFISYSDINWKWNIKNVSKYIQKQKVAIFTHKDFHPNLEVNSKSDFCLIKNNQINKISEKKTFSNNYKNDYLAIGCYFFKNLNYINSYFKKKNNIFLDKKEFYIVSLIQDLIKKRIKISNFNIKKFVHLGIPSQYTDFLKWKNILETNKKNKISVKKNSCIMLMGGKGKRLSNFVKPKPFLEYEKKPIYEHIFSKFITKRKIIITNKNYINKINKKNYKVLYVKKTKSMFDTVFAARDLLQRNSNYFLTSCDCFGNFNLNKFRSTILKDKTSLMLFAFEYSNLQKSLGSSHTQLKIKNKKLYDIDVKKNYVNKNYGHAGFFWIKDGSVFKYLYSFRKSKYFRNLKREVLIDDYFKYLIQDNLVKVSYSLLNNYIHIGSESEYLEYKYWSNYFKK